MIALTAMQMNCQI